MLRPLLLSVIKAPLSVDYPFPGLVRHRDSLSVGVTATATHGTRARSYRSRMLVRDEELASAALNHEAPRLLLAGKEVKDAQESRRMLAVVEEEPVLPCRDGRR
jgi:hypothetical protein